MSLLWNDRERLKRTGTISDKMYNAPTNFAFYLFRWKASCSGIVLFTVYFFSVRITTALLFHNLYRFLKIYVESICDLCPPHHICYEINEWQEFIVSQVLFRKKTGKLFKRLSLGQMLRRFLFSHRILCRKQTFLRSFQLSRPIVWFKSVYMSLQ